MPPPHIIHMLSHAESGLQRKLKRSESGVSKLTRAEPRLMRADGGATSSPLQKYREQNPQYKDIPDDQLAAAIYKKYYANHMTPQQFYAQIGIKAPTDAGQGLVQQRSRVDAPHLAQPEAGDMLSDIGQSAAAGAVRSVANVPGLPGNVVEGVGAAQKALGTKPAPNVTDWKPPTTQDLINLTPQEIQRIANYEPQSPIGKIIEAGIEMFGPGAIFSGANRPQKLIAAGIKYGLIPGMTGEVAAEATPDPAWKPAARVAGSLMGIAPVAAVSDVARGPGAASRAAEDWKIPVGQAASNAMKAAIARDPAAAAKANQIQLALSRNVGAGRSGTSSAQYQNAFKDLENRLNEAAATGKPLAQLFNPDERAVIQRIAAGGDSNTLTQDLAKLRGWKTFGLLLGGVGAGFATHAFNNIADIQNLAPWVLGASGVSATVGRVAKQAENVAQGRDISGLTQDITGLNQPRAGTISPFMLPSYASDPTRRDINYATVPPPPEDDSYGP